MKDPKVGDVVDVYDCGHDHPMPVVHDNQAFGMAYPLRDGQPLNGLPGGHLIHRDTDGICRIIAETGRGPLQVATKEYREGWDRTFLN